MKKKKVIFVQGFGDYSDGIWPGWLGQELGKAGFEFEMLKMPDPVYPEVHEWLDFIKKQKIRIDSRTYFVGHSLGCITIARYLESLSGKKKARGCVFVAGFCSLPEFPLLFEFCSLPLDFTKVKERAQDFVMIISDNDHTVPRILSEEMAEKVGAKIIIEPGKGHFKEDVREIPSVLNTILEWDQMNDEEKEIEKLERKNRK